MIEKDGDRDKGDGQLGKELGAGRKAATAFFPEFQSIVNEADHGKSHGHKESNRDIGAHDIREEGGGENQGKNDQRPSHRRSAGLGRVARRAIFADRLADLHGCQGANQVWT